MQGLTGNSIRRNALVTFRSGIAYYVRRQMANTHTESSETRRHIVKGMIGAAALARSYSFAAPLNAEGEDGCGRGPAFHREGRSRYRVLSRDRARGSSGSPVVAWLRKLIALLSAPYAAAREPLSSDCS